MKLLYPWFFIITILLFSCAIDANEIEPAWTSRFIKTNGVRLHVLQTSGEGTRMVLAHGGISNASKCWRELADMFRKEYAITMYDARGHGDSQRAGTNYTLHDHARDLMGLIQTLRIKKPILIGHSMGSYATLLTAATHPKVAQAIILIDPMLRLFPSQNEAKAIESFEHWAHNVKQSFLTLFEQKSDLIKKVDIHSLSVIDHIAALRLEDFASYFQKISCPILIISADAEMELKERERKFLKPFPNIQLIHMANAGHVVHRDCPKQTVEAIFSFLDKLK